MVCPVLSLRTDVAPLHGPPPRPPGVRPPLPHGLLEQPVLAMQQQHSESSIREIASPDYSLHQSPHLPPEQFRSVDSLSLEERKQHKLNWMIVVLACKLAWMPLYRIGF